MTDRDGFLLRWLMPIRELLRAIAAPLSRFFGLRRQQRLGLVILTCTVAFSLISCLAAPQSPVQIGYSIWPGYESLYLARDLGYYKEKSVRLVNYPSNSEIIRAFRNGDLDVATLTMYEALLTAETNPEVKVVLVMDSSHGADVVLGQPNMQSLKDIQGKRVGLESGALGAFVFTRAFEQAELDATGIKLVSLGVSEHETAFKSGLVDAIVTYEPTRSKLISKGAKLLFDSSKIPGEIIDVLVVHDQVIRKRPEVLQEIVKGHFEAIAYMAQNPQDAAKRIAPREGVTPQQFLESLTGIKIPSIAENREILGRRDSESQRRVQRVSDFMRQANLQRSPISLSSLFDDQFVTKPFD
ncbi:MAG: ABC transporter substrate-binding protein [Alkalinema sp. RL_2_19]|nr:ABC transporter substrate-binding protein [Alkalinema sp. RL_2_19]